MLMRFPTGIGQYVPVESPVHRLDAVAKVLLVVAVTAAVFLVDGFVGLLAVLGLVGVALAVSRISPRIALRGLTSVSVILLFTLVAHTLRWSPDVGDALLSIGRLRVSAQGLETGVFFALRIVALVVGTSLLTLTTSPVDLAEGLERLMRPLARLRFPAHDIAMMLSVALRFIPATAEEAERIVTAQRARGARFDRGGPIRRARAYVPVLVPLFVGLFRRADRLATAMEARCYRGGEGRTRLKEARMSGSDWTVVFVGVLVSAAIAVWL
jgi:energy-coupling factor transport system permease protein